jgi:hypothetical protein
MPSVCFAAHPRSPARRSCCRRSGWASPPRCSASWTHGSCSRCLFRTGRLAIGLKAEAQRPTEPKLFIGFRDWEAWAGGNRSFTSLAAVFWRSFEADDPSQPAVFGMVATAEPDFPAGANVLVRSPDQRA